MPIQLLYITDSEGMGGAERYLRTLIEHARLLGADTGLVLPERQATRPLVEAAELAGAQVTFADYVHRQGLSPAVIAQAAATLRRLAPATVHFVLPAPRRSAEWTVAAALAGVPRRIATFQLVGPVPEFGRLAGLLRRLNRSIQYRMLHQAIAVSAENQELLVAQYGFPAPRLALIHNGVDTNHYAPQADGGVLRSRLGIPPSAPLIAFAGRLTPSKGPQLLLEAMPAVWQQCPMAHLVIAGAGDLEVELRTKAGGLERAAQVHLPGSFVDIRPLLAACDIFVLPSLIEGLPFAVLEAMAMARAVVATAVGGTPEVIIDHQTGVLIPPGDRAALANALTRLLADPLLRGQLGQAARERIVANFSEQQMLARTWELYA